MTKTQNFAVLGLQWGDEGKGKIVNFLSPNFHATCRFQGGHNAGHTLIVNGKKLILHLLPSSICEKDALSLIGKGVVLSPNDLFEEISEANTFLEGVEDRLKISSACVLILDHHKKFDQCREKSNSFKTIGTTGRGIGPAYEDKVGRRAIRLVDCFYEKILEEKLRENLDFYNFMFNKLFSVEEVSFQETFEKALSYGERLRPMTKDISKLIIEMNNDGKKVLFEGAQGALLDVDNGTYPYVTSSNSSAAGIASGSGLGPLSVSNILGIAKAYTTRVGEGPMPTELFDDIGIHIAKKGGEVGATTGRPRRCGWFDAVAMKKVIQSNSVKSLCITKLDVFDGMESIKICESYDNSDEFFEESLNLDHVKPQYIELSGWKKPIYGLKTLDDFPKEAIEFISKIEEVCGVSVDILSTGPERESTIFKNDII